MDFSIFDVLLDSIFVVNKDRQVVYCNEVAASLCNSSVKRITKGRVLHDFIQFSDETLFVMPNGSIGLKEIAPLKEVKYFLKGEDKGKIQIAIQPFLLGEEDHCIVFIRDVTIEEVLHSKYKIQLEEKEQYINDLQDAREKLEDYSKNLEQKVEERTVELKKANNMLSAIMDSLGQGFLVFDKEGICSDIYTKACEDILEIVPSGKNIIQVLNCTGEDENQFKMWMGAVFSESLPFDSLKELAPQTFSHSQDKHISLDYFALRQNEEISEIVLVATDRTAEIEANIALEKEKSFANMVVKLVTNKKQFSSFIREFPHSMKRLFAECENVQSFDVHSVFRNLHTIEGESAAFSITNIQMAAKACQEIIMPIRDGHESEFSTVKNKFLLELESLQKTFETFLDKNSDLLNLLDVDGPEEIVMNQAVLKAYMDKFIEAGVSPTLCSEFLHELEKKTIQEVLSHFNNVVSQVANKQGKQIEPIHFFGGDLRVDFKKYELLFSSFVHIFRNIVDHGLELPHERRELNKQESGRVELSAKERFGFLELIIKDDGRGISPDIIREKAQEKLPGINTNELDDHNILQIIFAPGFTSREQAEEFSGRGVGMDAVKHEVVSLGGTIEVFSTYGQGTEFVIRVPLPDIEKNKKSA